MAVLASCGANAGKQASAPEQVCQQIGFAWNLGNHFDSTVFGPDPDPSTARYWDGATPTEELYKNLAANGVKTVRIPVTWGSWESPAPEYNIKPEFMELVKKNVHWAKDNGLNVILNLHHDEYWLDIYNATFSDSVSTAIMQRVDRTWSQIAEAFKDEGEYLFFETFNEVHAANRAIAQDWSGAWARENEKSLEILNEWTEVAVKAIRATGSVNSTRWIVLNGYAGNPHLAMEYLRMPEDPAGKLMISVHTYSPVEFTLEDKTELWGVGETKEADEKAIVDLFQTLGSFYTSQGIPVYLGEFGCDAHATAEGEANRLRYLTLIAQEARKVNIPIIIWDNGYPGAGAEHHAYFNHNDGSIVEGSETIIKTLVDIYND